MSNIDLNKHPDETICRCCGEKRVKTFHKPDGNGRNIYVDEFGERWYGKKCPVCYKKYKLQYDEKRRIKLGHRPFGSIATCDCGARFVVKVGSTTKCSECKSKTFRERLA